MERAGPFCGVVRFFSLGCVVRVVMNSVASALTSVLAIWVVFYRCHYYMKFFM